MIIRKVLSALLCMAVCIHPALAVASAGKASAGTDAQKATAPDWVMPHSVPGPSLYGAHAALLCADTGEMLLGKSMNTQTAPASITKVMTALLVLEHCPDLSVKTTVTASAVNSVEQNSTHIGLKPGEVVTLEQMMAAMLIHSANDAANVLAEHVAGSLPAFASMMNARAKALGCTHTHFANANGLDNPQHLTTAHDMALIGQAVQDKPDFVRFAGALEYTMPPTNLCPTSRTFYTKQNILCHSPEKYYYAGAFAGKNGWTNNAHQTLISFARRDGVTLVAVTMKSDSRYPKVEDTIALFNYGFSHFSMQTIPAKRLAAAGQSLQGVSASAWQDTRVLLPKGVSVSQLKLQAVPGAHPAIAVSLGNDRLMKVAAPQKAAAAVKTLAHTPAASPHRTGWEIAASAVLLLLAAGFAAYRLTRARRPRRAARRPGHFR